MSNITSFDYKKAVQAINYLTRKFPDRQINKMKALKLLWAADRYHLRKYGRSVVGDTYVAMKYGPVPSGTKDLLDGNSYLEPEIEYSDKFLKPSGAYNLRSVGEVDADFLSESDLEALEFAILRFGDLDQWQLYKLTHNYPEWKKFEVKLDSKQSLVELMDYSDFFGNPDMDNDVFALDSAELQQSKELYEENSMLNSV